MCPVRKSVHRLYNNPRRKFKGDSLVGNYKMLKHTSRLVEKNVMMLMLAVLAVAFSESVVRATSRKLD